MGSPAASSARTFRALRHRNFRLYMGGMLVSVVGSWMQQTAQSWLVYRLTHSEFLLGVTWFCANAPILFLGAVAGLAADRFPRRTIVLWTQVAAMAQAAALAWLTYSGRIQTWHILMLALLLGVVNAFDVPGRQALYIHLVDKEDLVNAISLNSAMFNTARAAGPGLAGILVAAVGEAPCFLLNSISYLAVIASLLAMRINKGGATEPSGSSSLRDGFRHVWHTPRLRRVLAIAGLTSLASAPLSALAPVFAEGIFHQGPRGLGFLTSAMGVGAVLGTLNLARKTRLGGLPKVVAIASATMTLCLTLYAVSPSYYVTLAVMPLAGMSIMRLNAGSQTLVQSTVDNSVRGRVMGLYTTMFLGMFPVGSLLAGSWAAQAGPRIAVGTFALVCGGAAWWFWRGLPEVEHGLEARAAS